MKDTITLTKAAFARVLDAVYYPNPDDPGPYGQHGPHGPRGPVYRGIFNDMSWGMLNPQPIPPGGVPYPESWSMASLARMVIDRVATQYQFAESFAGTEPTERGIVAIRSYLNEVVDDWCGTRPPKWPWPWPWQKFDATKLSSMDLLIAGAQFHKAAHFSNPLQGDFSSAADRLFNAGLKRME